MSDQRPGGLTALGVINFILAAFSLLGLFATGMLLLILSGKIEIPPEAQQGMDAQLTELRKLPNVTTMLALSLASNVVSLILLVISGIGYFKQKKVMGRYIGTAYGVIGVATALLTAFTMPASSGGGFSIATMVSLLYPGLTLLLVNLVFKDDLVR